MNRQLVYISSSAIRTDDPLDAIARLHPICTNIELTGGGAHDPDLLPRLLAAQQAAPVNLLIHSYFPPPPADFVLNFADPGEQTRAFIRRAMLFVQQLNVPYYSVHAGFRADFAVDDHGLLHRQSEQEFTLTGIKENVAWFRSQWPAIPLALENIYPNNGNTACAFMMSLDEICEALEAIPEAFLLLDLGHLKISAQLMGFDFLSAAHKIFRRYSHRILELHLSENHGTIDDHLPVSADSEQYAIVREYAPFIRANAIRLTLEIRGATLKEVRTSVVLFQDVFQTR